MPDRERRGASLGVSWVERFLGCATSRGCLRPTTSATPWPVSSRDA